MDKVIIKGLACECMVGVYEFERHAKRPIFFDLVMDWDNRPAGLSDNLNDALAYDAVSAAVRDEVAQHAPQLIEFLAEKVAERLLSEFNIPRLTLTLHKPDAVEGTDTLAVEITRQRAV